MPGPSYEPQVRGVRNFVADYRLLCHVFQKYREAIVPLLPAELVEAMDLLCTLLAAVEALNPAGPF